MSNEPTPEPPARSLETEQKAKLDEYMDRMRKLGAKVGTMQRGGIEIAGDSHAGLSLHRPKGGLPHAAVR